MDGLAQAFEQRLARKPRENGEELSYEMRDHMLKFLDNLADIICLVYCNVQKIYIPHGKDWIRSRLYGFLKRYATREDECRED